MNKSLPLLVVQWLNKLHIPLSSGYITEKLLSHPDYPSLASVTDILEDLNIEHAAMVVDKERLKEIPVPFLAHINGKQADFILVTDTPDLYKKHPNFFAEWDGIVLIAETRQVFNSPENEQWRKRDNGNKKRTAAFASVILILSVLALYFQFSRMMAVLIITTMAGVFLCLLLVQQELGMSNPLTRKLCSEGANSDCDAVLKSAASKTFSWLSLSDSGFIWFISLYLLLTISSVTGAMPSIITLVSILILLPLPLTFFSLYYQWKVVTKWCPLCLLVVGVIWVQNSVNFSGASIADIKSVSVNALVLSAVVFTLAAISWLYIKSLLKERKKTSEKMYALQRFKNNQAVFTSLLFRQPVVDTTPWEGDLQLGDPKAPLQLLVACSPYCGPCAQAHFFLHSYLEKKQTGLTIRFAIDTEKREERKTQAVIWLLQLLAGTDQDYKRKVLHDWYTIVDLDKFKNMYPLEQQCNMEDQLFCLKQWNEKVKISFTPTIFINGHQLPPQYSVYDLAAFIGRIDEEMGRAGTEFKKIPGVSALESV